MRLNDSLNSYSREFNHVHTIVNAHAHQHTVPTHKPLPVDVLEALKRGDVDKALEKLQKQQPSDKDSLLGLITFMGKFREGVSLVFAFPQLMITKHIMGRGKEKSEKAEPKSEAAKQAQIRKAVDKLKNEPVVEKVGKEGNSSEVDVEIGQGKIVPGSLEWQKELARIAELARVAATIGNENLMNIILEILLDTLRLSKAAEKAYNTAERIGEYVQSTKELLSTIKDNLVALAMPSLLLLEKMRKRAVRGIVDAALAVQRTAKKKGSEIAAVLEPPLTKVVEHVKKGMDRLKVAAEHTVDKTREATAVVVNFVQNRVPEMVVYGFGWVYQLSPTTFDGIGNGFKGLVRSTVKLAKWLGNKSSEAFDFVSKWTLVALNIIQKGVAIVKKRVKAFLLWLKAKLIAFAKITRRLSVAFVWWTIKTIRSIPSRTRMLFYRLFDMSKYATYRLALKLEEQARRQKP